MELLTLSAGLLLPWLAGALWLMFIEARLNSGTRPNRLRQAGYGFFLGYALLLLAVVASNAWTGQVSWPWVMIFLALCAAGGGLALRLAARTGLTAVSEDRVSTGTAQKVLLATLAAWMGLHLLFVAIEILNQPVYPWDAWLAWVYRAKAWFLAGGMADVVSPSAWAAASSPEVYTVNAAGYPLLPSVIPYWAALSLGHWSETLVNAPVLLVGAAIGLALYGQCRESGMSVLMSLAACYLLFSIPLFGTHLALAGYADIWMAGFAGLGFIALMRGATAGRRFQTVLGLLMLALAICVKREAAVWFLAALLLQALVSFRWRTNLFAGLVIAGSVVVAYLFDVSHIEVPLLGTLGVVDGRLKIPLIGSFTLEIHNVWRVYLDNFFTMGSWNLLWLLVAACLLLAVAGRGASTDPARRVGAVFILIFLSTQLFIFGFTDQGVWADTYTAINRLPLHFVPALVFAALMIFNARSWQPDHPSAVPSRARPGPVPKLTHLTSTALLAAALVLVGTVALLSRGLPDSPAQAQRFAAVDFTFVMGSGTAEDDLMVVTGFDDGHALLSSGPVNLEAGAFRFLTVTLNAPAGAGFQTIFWRRSAAPDELNQLHIRDTGTSMVDLSVVSGWNGGISEFGFLLREGNGETLAIGPVLLESDSLTRRLRLTWDSWAAFEPWTQKSVNFLQGGKPDQPVRLPVLVIAWIFITLSLAWLLARFSSGRSGSRQLLLSGALIFMAAWMILDLRWTANSLQQMERTVATYRGAGEEQRLSSGLDGDIYRYILELKTNVLPNQPARILCLGDERIVEYFLQRAKYHLLPHSAYATRRIADGLAPHAVDYVLFFGAPGGIEALPGWDDSWREALVRKHSGAWGEVYAVGLD